MSKSKLLSEKKKYLEVRSCLLMAVRTFFYSHKFLEVETPIRIKNPALEDYIEAEPAGDCWLRTSPELHMKRMLAAGYEKIFQIGPCFREGEFGSRHRPEFTMLEWYEIGSDYKKILSQTRDLFRKVSQETNLREDYFSKEWSILSVDDAFRKYTGSPVEDFIEQGRFEDVLCLEVEPHLGFQQPTVLIDYPSSMAALSKKKLDNPKLAERWELYVDGVEIANAYSELTDPIEQQSRFEETQALRARDGRAVYEIDPDFMAALTLGLPECGGIAVGIERLCMVLAEVDDIAKVVFE